MNKEFDSFELKNFNCEDQINLDQEFGYLKIMRSDDNLLTLIEDSEYKKIDQSKTTFSDYFNRESALGFVLDIGIEKIKYLSRGSSFYFGTKLKNNNENKKITQKDYDKDLFAKIGNSFRKGFQSGDSDKEIQVIKFQNILGIYNNACLLFPGFHSESYLNLMRIIDTIADIKYGKGIDFAIFVTEISDKINKDVFISITNLDALKNRVEVSNKIFNYQLKLLVDNNNKNKNIKKEKVIDTMNNFKAEDKLMFSLFFSLYQYRNQNVHKGFPFPDIIKDSFKTECNKDVPYISFASGQSWARYNRPNENMKEEDFIDIHESLKSIKNVFKDQYFILLPTWYFLKKIARQAILNQLNKLT